MFISILHFWLFLLTETCCSLSLNFSLFFKYEQIKILHMKYYFGKCYKFWSLGELWMLKLWSFHFSSKENFKCLFPPDFVVPCPAEFTLYYTLAINSLYIYFSYKPFLIIFRNKGNKGYRNSLFDSLLDTQRLNDFDTMFITYYKKIYFSKLSDILSFTNQNKGWSVVISL